MNASYQRALLLHSHGRYADAANSLRQHLSIEPNDPNAHAMLGLCLSQLEQFGPATVEAQMAVGLAPSLAFAHYVYALVMFRRNRTAEAMPAIVEAIRLEPDNADFFSLLASLRYDMRNWPSALEAAEIGLTHDPRHVNCSNMRAMALVKLGRRDEAGLTIEASLQRNPDDAVSHANQGWTLLHNGDPKKAMEHFREALRLDPNLEWARAGIVEALKARFFLYRWMLAYFLWMARLSSRAQWGILLTGYFGSRLLRTLANDNPALGKYVWPVLISYIIFAILTWIASPMFNLLLRLSRFGRLALNRKQTIESNCIGPLLAGAAACAIVWWRTGGIEWGLLAMVSGLLVLPVTGIFRASDGWPQIVAIAAAAILALMGLMAAALVFIALRSQGAMAQQLGPFALQSLSLFGWGVLIASFGLNWLNGVKAKR